MKVFIVGKLGEVIKKVLELEDIIAGGNSDPLILMELTVHQRILAVWPVLDTEAVGMAIYGFRLHIAKLKEAEQELLNTEKDSPYLFDNVMGYMKYLQGCRESLASLNEMGKHLGPDPWMELEDEMAKSNDNDPVPSG